MKQPYSSAMDALNGNNVLSLKGAKLSVVDSCLLRVPEGPPQSTLVTKAHRTQARTPSASAWSLTERDLQSLLHCVAQRTDYASQAFTILYAHYAQRLFRFYLLRLRDAATAEELMLDVFLIVWKSAHTYDGLGSLDVWLFGIAHNLYRNARRRALQSGEAQTGVKTNAAIILPLHKEQLLPTVTLTIDAPSRDLDPAEQTATHQRFALVQRALRNLALVHREVLHFTYFEGLKVHDIARLLGVSSGTVKSRMFHARRLRWRYLQNDGFTQEDLCVATRHRRSRKKDSTP